MNWKKYEHKSPYLIIDKNFMQMNAERRRELLVKLRQQKTVERVEKPLRLRRARAIGYKAKPGYIVVQVKVRRGPLHRTRPKRGHKPRKMGYAKRTPGKSLLRIAEERAARKFKNLVVLGAYYLIEDGKNVWFEVIMVDPHHPVPASDFQKNGKVKKRLCN